MKIQFAHKFEDIISLENLLLAWQEFIIGKRNKRDVQTFSLYLTDNIFALHYDLLHYTYKHGPYQAFKINDPKPRDIHKAQVRDRLLHHAIYRLLYPFFDRIFISDSYSCRNDKGTHKAINKFHKYFYKASKNNIKTCYALKCDIRKFFASIDHEILLHILAGYIPDKDILRLLKNIIESFSTNQDKKTGLPLGNLTSQLFANVYLNELDQFIKHKLKVKHYIRYADDFLILSDSKVYLKEQIPVINEFLTKELKLKLHPHKIFIKTVSSGVDFLGIINFTDHRILRTKTKRRMIKKIKNNKEKLSTELISEEFFNQSLQSYYGILKHCCGHKIKQEIKNYYNLI